MKSRFKVGDRIKLNPNNREQYSPNIKYMTYGKDYIIESIMRDSSGCTFCTITVDANGTFGNTWNGTFGSKWNVYTRHLMKAGVNLNDKKI